MTLPAPSYACIEAGGTKFVVGIARAPDEVLETARFPTTTPHETLGQVTAWFEEAVARHGPVRSAGIASFGPVELDRASPKWGFVTDTPKPGWSDTDIAGRIAKALNVPVGFDTDVNGAGIAEARWGAALGQRVAVYITVGTGLGGGVIVDGRPLTGLSHAEMGHMRVPRHPDDLGFEGICPFHGDCLEGLVSGPAIMKRWGTSLSHLPADHPAHEIVALYLAQLVTTLQASMEPGRILFGGGVMGTPGLINRIGKTAEHLGAGYFRGAAKDIVSPPGLGDRAGLLGALALAMDAG